MPLDQDDVSASPAESPLIGPGELRYFDIVDTRRRADCLKEYLVPKLNLLLDKALEVLEGIYGSYALTPFRRTATPAHRPGAAKTQSFDCATAGLAVNGKAWFFQQRFSCNAERLYVELFGLRGHEANPIVEVMKKHPEGVLNLLGHVNCNILSAAVAPSPDIGELSTKEYISRLQLFPEREWARTAIETEGVSHPIKDTNAQQDVIHDFLVLFPLFRAATHVLQGEDDDFDHYLQLFLDNVGQGTGDKDNEHSAVVSEVLVDTRIPEDSQEGLEFALEGGFKVAMQRHYLRELRLRKAKIKEVLNSQNGRLRCEVPGCSFDFFEVYGEIGRDYIHVHHTKPLSDRSEPEMTRLSDLVTVCANCHAMIHRGTECRALEDLIPI